MENKKEKSSVIFVVFLLGVLGVLGFNVNVVCAEPTDTTEISEIPATWYEDYTYDIDDEEKTIILTRRTGDTQGKSITVPGKAVIDDVEYGTVVSGNVFFNHQSLREVCFDEGVKIYNMNGLFCACFWLEKVDLSKADLSDVHDMTQAFDRCYALKSVDFGGFDTKGLIFSSIVSCNSVSMKKMFNDCEKLSLVDLCRFDMSKVSSTEELFSGCNKLYSIITPHVKSDELSAELPRRMCDADADKPHIYIYTDLKQAPADRTLKTETEWFKEYNYEFDEENQELLLTKYKGLDADVIIPGKTVIGEKEYAVRVTGEYYFFSGMTSVQSILLEDGVKCKSDMSYMFYNCPNVKKIVFGDVDTSECTNMKSMFNMCSKLEEINMSSFDMSNVADAELMFTDVTNLRIVRAPKISNPNLQVLLPRSMYEKNADGVFTDVSYSDLMLVPSQTVIYVNEKELAEKIVGVGQTFEITLRSSAANSGYTFVCEDGCELNVTGAGSALIIDTNGIHYDYSYSLKITIPGLHKIHVNSYRTLVNTYVVYVDESIKPHTVKLFQKIGGTIRSDRSDAFYNEKVKMSYDKTSGYEFGSWTIKDANGDMISVDRNNTFVMPDSDVTVYATFRGKGSSTSGGSSSSDGGSTGGGSTGGGSSGGGNSGSASGGAVKTDKDKTSEEKDTKNPAVSANTLPNDTKTVEEKKIGGLVGETFNIDGYRYKITSETEVTCDSRFVHDEKYKMPDAVTINEKSYKVTAVSDKAFEEDKTLKTVIIGNNVTKIGKNAFSGCVKLKKVIVSSNVETISSCAFSGCKSLKVLYIRSEKLTKKGVKNSLKGSSIKRIGYYGEKRTVFLPKYKKIFKKSNSGRKVSVKSY